MYTCQLFPRYKREIFILGVREFLKRTRSFPKIPEEVWTSPKTSKEVWSLPKKSEVFRRTCIKASSLPVFFSSQIRDREEGIVIYSFYTWFSFLTWVWVNIFLEIVSSMLARGQQLTFFNQAWEIGHWSLIGPQAILGDPGAVSWVMRNEERGMFMY